MSWPNANEPMFVILYFIFFNVRHSGCELLSNFEFNLHFPDDYNDIEYPYICLLTILMSSFEKRHSKFFAIATFKICVAFLLLNVTVLYKC